MFRATGTSKIKTAMNTYNPLSALLAYFCQGIVTFR